MIHFRLNNIDDIVPFGSDHDQTMHWFALTYGEYWIDLKNATLFEYSEEALNYWGITDHKYVNYPISRFIDHFTSLFYDITESIPDDLFENIKSAELLNKIEAHIKTLREREIHKRLPYDQDMIIEEVYVWIRNRTMDSAYFVGGPDISFFRNNEKILIIWTVDYLIENKIPLWTAQTGKMEMNYGDFILQVEDFGRRFLEAMEEQVNKALEKDWGVVKIDKTQLKETQIERQSDFEYWIAILKQEGMHKKLSETGFLYTTDWKKVKDSLEQLINISSDITTKHS